VTKQRKPAEMIAIASPHWQSISCITSQHCPVFVPKFFSRRDFDHLCWMSRAAHYLRVAAKKNSRSFNLRRRRVLSCRGIRGTHTEIETACAHYGYHPLGLCLLAGMIVNDLRQPGDIAVSGRIDISGDLKQRRHHVLETAYNSLAPTRQALLSRIACFRSPVDTRRLKLWRKQ